MTYVVGYSPHKDDACALSLAAQFARSDKQHRHRMPVAREEVLIRRADHAHQQPVFHGPPVDEQILVLRAPPIERRQAGEPRHTHAFAFRIDLDRVLAELLAQHSAQSLQPRLIPQLGRKLDDRPLFRFQMEGYVRSRERQTPHSVRATRESTENPRRHPGRVQRHAIRR